MEQGRKLEIFIKTGDIVRKIKLLSFRKIWLTFFSLEKMHKDFVTACRF